MRGQPLPDMQISDTVLALLVRLKTHNPTPAEQEILDRYIAESVERLPHKRPQQARQPRGIREYHASHAGHGSTVMQERLVVFDTTLGPRR